VPSLSAPVNVMVILLEVVTPVLVVDDGIGVCSHRCCAMDFNLSILKPLWISALLRYAKACSVVDHSSLLLLVLPDSFIMGIRM
jgi:hypothetical protein